MREPARNFRDLIVWQKAHKLVLDVYNLSANFPKLELFGLTSQLRRSTVSVPANIAEGFRRKHIADKSRFINIAQSSLEESRYYLILAHDLNYADCKPCSQLAQEVSKLLDVYNSKLR